MVSHSAGCHRESLAGVQVSLIPDGYPTVQTFPIPSGEGDAESCLLCWDKRDGEVSICREED